MNITLKFKEEGKKERVSKKFTTFFIPAKLFKDTITLVKNFEDMSEEEMLKDTDVMDSIVQYIVDTFDGQFTIEELYAGLEVSDIMVQFQNCIKTVMEKFGNKSAELAKVSPNK